MSDLLVFVSIIGWFFVWLLVKELTKSRRFCAICAAVSTTWLLLLGLRSLELFTNEVLLALLLGASLTGGYYWLSQKKSLALYKLPIFLSLALLAYTAVQLTWDWYLFGLVGLVWLVFFGFSVLKVDRGLVKRIIECCKNW